ncbi:MAG: diguanylate cyclase [Pseudomonadota bacterium]
MHGKILIVDAIPTNRIVLKVKLAAAFYTVEQAASIEDAVERACEARPDLVVAAADLPGGGAARLARRLAASTGGHVPVIVQGSRIQPDDRLALLEAGVDEVLALPVSDALLLAQVRGALRAQAAASEWTIREGTARALGLAEAAPGFGPAPKIRIVAPDPLTLDRWTTGLLARMDAQISAALPPNALSDIAADSGAPDIFVLALPAGAPEQTLALLSSVRAGAATRHSAVLLLQAHRDDATAARALDLGADALMQTRFDAAELAHRLRGLVARKRIADQLRRTLRSGLDAAVSDPLTGLHNRRYAMPHLVRVAERAEAREQSFAVMIADLDHFKGINDRYGHAAGDAVLIETAERLRTNLRGSDMVARIGGEEFLIVMPGIDLTQARSAATRLCQLISDRPFSLDDGRSVPVTVSIGLALGSPGSRDSATTFETHARALIDHADRALYRAKTKGRNCVRLSRPAA